MVSRKPVPANVNIDLPYPHSPIMAQSHPSPLAAHPTPSYFHGQDTKAENPWHQQDMSHLPYSGDTENYRVQHKDFPDTVPESLRAGSGQYTPRSSSELPRPTQFHPSNPYTKQQHNNDSSAQAWSAPPSAPPPPPPIMEVTPPTPAFSKISLNQQLPAVDPVGNPWEPAIDPQPIAQHAPGPSFKREDSGNEAWATAPPDRAPPPMPPSESIPNLIDLEPEDESPAWDEEEELPIIGDLPTYDHVQTSEEQGQHEESAWQESENQRRQQESTAASEKAAQAEQIRKAEGWASTSGMQPQESGVVGADGVGVVMEADPRLPPRPIVESLAIGLEEAGPAHSPRPLQEESEPPRQPPRPIAETSMNESNTSLASAVKRQKKESYEIRKINWYDSSAAKNPRVSPILVQNINGPCPLLALVNSLTLSTPADLNTPLVEALRSREQISLLLLLDAVIDELMSGRRGTDDQDLLPDVIDLHYFLLDLHTGMNVNPRFLPLLIPDEKNNVFKRPSTQAHPGGRESTMPGTFEHTREIDLYNTFNIPLIHGWLPTPNSKVSAALERSAPSYEEVQNIQFRQEELEEKIMNAEGLSFQEQGLLDDITIIKEFLNESATQLTPYGIEAISRSLLPGQFAILFRNNHFSTLYRHPDDHALFSLVTDMGYATHDEVVWESLADTNGESSELFSGDFRVVVAAASRPSSPRASTSSVNNSGWTPVQGRQRRNPSSTSFVHTRNDSQTIDSALSSPTQANTNGPQSPNTEQEDHDLALALQMQDEEDRLLEEARTRRRREQELSQQYIESETNNTNSSTNARTATVPVSTSSNRGGRHTIGGIGGEALRPSIPPRRSGNPQTAPQQADPEAGVDAPPPSYEQAATLPAYNPPADSPNHAAARPGTAGGRRNTSAYSTNTVNAGRGRGGGLVDRIPTRRQSQGQGNQGPTQAPQEERGKDCIVM